jgi:hypothetical protein
VSIKNALDARKAQSLAPKMCKLGYLLRSLGGDLEEQQALATAIDLVRKNPDDDLFSVSWLVGVLKDNGHSIGKTVVSEHVRGVCVCDSGQ